MSRLLIATNNRGKVKEIQALLSDLKVELVTPDLLGVELHVEEHGETYAENAALKAVAFSKLTGLLTLADDSGLEVDALGGQPGLYSARFSFQPGATDADRRAYLLHQLKLQQLQGQARPWTARFRCVIALAAADRPVQFAEGICEGEIIPEERGANGFGYDPIFLFPALGKTMAELSMAEKNQISHRARAVMAARPLLASIVLKY